MMNTYPGGGSFKHAIDYTIVIGPTKHYMECRKKSKAIRWRHLTKVFSLEFGLGTVWGDTHEGEPIVLKQDNAPVKLIYCDAGMVRVCSV